MMATDIDTAEDDFNKQKIVSDYFTTNPGALTLPMGSNNLDNTCFSVPDMAKYEFFLSGTVRVDMDTEEATEINLMQGVNVLAQASYTTGTMLESELDRHFTLFYKGMNMSADDFSVMALVPGTAGADVEIRDLQWGVRVYTEDYPLTSTAPTCT